MFIFIIAKENQQRRFGGFIKDYLDHRPHIFLNTLSELPNRNIYIIFLFSILNMISFFLTLLSFSRNICLHKSSCE